MEQSDEEPTSAPETATVTPTTGVGESLTTISVPPPLPPDFTKVDNNLTGIGFFTASSKRSRKAIEKTTVVTDHGIEHKISILPSAKYGLPITQDQDFWLGLMKLVSEHTQREGKLTNPFAFTTAQLLRILGKEVNDGRVYKAVEEWLSVMAFTGIEGGAYNTVRKTWIKDKTHAVDRVVNVGKELPDGTIADKNYIWFSSWQLDNINAGNLIPIELATYTLLQNNIAKNLVPHLQEWLYASQRDGRFEKQYEDICQLLGIRIYKYRSDIERKLGPSLDELVNHGYVSKWAIEPMANRKTYKLVIWHGHKYHRDQQHRLDRKERSKLSGAGAETAVHRPRQRHLNLKAAAVDQALQPAPAVIDYRLVAELTKRGISETDARTVLAGLPPGQAVLDQLEYGDLQISQSRGKLTNPPGFYISVLQRNVTPPPTFETSQARKTRQEAEFAQAEAIHKAQQDAEAKEKADQQRLDQLFATLSPDEQSRLQHQVKAELKTRYPNVNWDDNTAVHEGTIRAGIRRLLQNRPVPPVSQSAPTVADQQEIGEAVVQQASPPLTPLQLLTILTMLQLPAPVRAPAKPEVPQF